MPHKKEDSPMNIAAQHVSINHGVDFERAVEVLQAKAGQAFRQYRAAKKSDVATPAEIDALREIYVQANADAESLNRNDGERINQILTAGRA